MPILLGLLLVVSLSVNAQVLEPQHRTQNWFSAWAAFGSSVKAVLPLYLLRNPSHRHPGLEPGSRIPHQVRNDKSRHCERSEAIQKSWMATSPSAPRHDDLVGYARNLLNRLKRIQELLVHIAESTSSVSQQQKKEELRTQLSLLEYRPDLEEEEKEAVEIMVVPIPVVLLPPMHQLPSLTGAAPEGGNPGDPNPAAVPTLGVPQQLPAFNATQATEWTLAQLNCKLKAIKNARPPNCGQVILSGIQGYGPQIGYALLATIISKFIPPTTKTIPGLKAVNAIFKTHTEWPVIAYELEHSPAVLNTTPWNRPFALGIWVIRVGDNFLPSTALRGSPDLSFFTQVGDHFLKFAQISGDLCLPALSRVGEDFFVHASISGNLDLPSLTQVGRNFLKEAQIRGNLDLSSLTKVGPWFLRKAIISKNLNLPLLTKMGSDFLEHAQIIGIVNLSSLTREDITFGEAVSYHTLYTLKTSPSQGPDQDDSRRKQRSYCCCF